MWLAVSSDDYDKVLLSLYLGDSAPVSKLDLRRMVCAEAKHTYSFDEVHMHAIFGGTFAQVSTIT